MLLSIHCIDGGLELGHGLEGDEEEEEGEGDEENILVDQHPLPPLLLLLLHLDRVLGLALKDKDKNGG